MSRDFTHNAREGWGTLSCLEQGGGAALPGRAFFFGDILHVSDVGSSLRKHMVQVVADTDEGESFFQEFADSRRTEQKKTQDDVVLAGMLDQAFGGGV